MKPIIDEVNVLCTFSPSSAHYRQTLVNAGMADIKRAIDRMKMIGGKNKTRIAMCERELRIRRKVRDSG